MTVRVLLVFALFCPMLWAHSAAAAADAGTDLQQADSAAASSGAYWIFFSDKAIGSDAEYQQALSAVVAGYSPAAIARRATRGTATGAFGYHDLPVASAYVSSVLESGATLRVESPWLNAVSVRADAAQLATIAALPFVDRVQIVAQHSLPAATLASGAAAAPSDVQGFYGPAEWQLEMINIPDVHDILGYTGAGVTIGVLDTGFKLTHDAFNNGPHAINILDKKDFTDGTPTVVDETAGNQHVHGTQVLSTIGGYLPNLYVGAAYNAAFLLAKTEVTTSETQVEEDYWVDGLEWLEMNGADVVTSSLGYINWYTQAQLDGQTAVTTIAADMATNLGLPIINAAGNSGHAGPGSSLIAPSDAELVITVGAVNSSGVLASFSSSGPTADGRLKPEVLAPGVGVSVVNPNNDTLYGGVNGTSFAAPLVAATVALMLEANPTLTVEQLRNFLFTTASRAGNPDTTNYDEGYGIINAYAAVLAALGLTEDAAPVPEPSTLALAALAAVALGMMGVRRKVRRQPPLPSGATLRQPRTRRSGSGG